MSGGADLVTLDKALTALAEVDPRKGQVVEMRFFGGLSVEEVAEVLKVSKETQCGPCEGVTPEGAQ